MSHPECITLSDVKMGHCDCSPVLNSASSNRPPKEQQHAILVSSADVSRRNVDEDGLSSRLPRGPIETLESVFQTSRLAVLVVSPLLQRDGTKTQEKSLRIRGNKRRKPWCGNPRSFTTTSCSVLCPCANQTQRKSLAPAAAAAAAAANMHTNKQTNTHTLTE